MIDEVVANTPDLERSRRKARSQDQAPGWVRRVLSEMPKPTWPYGGTTASFTVAAENGPNPDVGFDSYLQVTINAMTGYGALMWLLPENSRIRVEAEIADYVWLSDNADPPADDPHVFADPGYPLFHHPRRVLPTAQIRAAVEEYCRDATGLRPTSISWTKGRDMTGGRLDQPLREY
ncbi:Imm1 family immunity protein [Actinomadura rupiterrae]|uniref:Imm1 family immunity protein n=1 Tax=Actinomadura rupiterrae TaxID=559627 RepID=UPI0020A4533D|nr:Imm1 family immunity protein [Actinomadura rupiterrae]MCP2341219.1 hypothetical protein [Actinomadura rupiterrae]